MDSVVNVLLSNGIGGAMALAVVWQLYHLHTTTLPALMNAFRTELAAERRQCREDHEKHEQALDRTSEQVRKLAEVVGMMGAGRYRPPQGPPPAAGQDLPGK